MSDIQAAIAAAVKVRLTRMGMTQEALAKQVGMSPASLSARLAGRTLFDTGDFDRFASALAVGDAFDLVDLARHERIGRAA